MSARDEARDVRMQELLYSNEGRVTDKPYINRMGYSEAMWRVNNLG